MAESPFDEPSDSTTAEQIAPTPSARPQLRLHHLFALTAVMAVLLGINGPQRSFANAQYEQSQLMQSFSFVVGTVYMILASIAVTATCYGIAWRRRGLAFFNEPGHWLMVEISIATLLGIVPSLAVRSISNIEQMTPGDFPMTVMMLVGVYSLLFLFLGRIVINIYLGKMKCAEPRWKSVFYAKAVATMLIGLADILVIWLIAIATRTDRRLQITRDLSHRCGVAVQLGISGLTILGVLIAILNMILFWSQ